MLVKIHWYLICTNDRVQKHKTINRHFFFNLQYLRLRFSEDLRVQEARRMLQSSRPVIIALTQKPEISDHDFIEEQEHHLYSICIRTMALPTGRYGVQ